MLTASDSRVRVVVDRADDGVDPLGIDPGTISDGNMLLSHARDLIERALLGRDDDVRQKLQQSLLQHGYEWIQGLDEVTAAVMAHHGVDPIAAAWLAIIDQFKIVELLTKDPKRAEITVTVEAETHHTSSNCRTSVVMAKDIWWYAYGIIVMPAMPETIANATVGQPLKHLLSHPVLDKLPFVIDDIELGQDPKAFVYVSAGDHDIRPMLVMDAPRAGAEAQGVQA